MGSREKILAGLAFSVLMAGPLEAQAKSPVQEARWAASATDCDVRYSGGANALVLRRVSDEVSKDATNGLSLQRIQDLLRSCRPDAIETFLTADGFAVLNAGDTVQLAQQSSQTFGRMATYSDFLLANSPAGLGSKVRSMRTAARELSIGRTQ